MMKNVLKMMALLAVCGLTFVGCSEKQEATENAAGAAAARKTFTVGFDAEFPPYGFKDVKTGDYRGFDLDLAAEVAKRNGWKLVKKPIDWAAKDSELNSGTIDCIWNGFTMTAERKEQYTWTDAYCSNKQLVMTKKDSGIKALKDLKGKIIVAQDGSSGAGALNDWLEEQKKADPTFVAKEVKLVPDYNTANTMLLSGAVDAIALDSAVAENLCEKSNGKFVILDEKLADEEFGVGFKKGNTELRDTVQKTLLAMVADGTVSKILNHWINEEKENKGAGIRFILKAD